MLVFAEAEHFDEEAAVAVWRCEMVVGHRGDLPSYWRCCWGGWRCGDEGVAVDEYRRHDRGLSVRYVRMV